MNQETRMKNEAVIPQQSQKGQVMLLTVILLSGAILGATSLTGLLVLYQIRQATDVTSSTQAIFAADSGLECALYQHFKDLTQDCSDVLLGNGARFQTGTLSGGNIVRSVGQVGRSARAFELNFGGP